ncbi:MAG: VanW family protein [Candidatus Caldatribacterium sp.]|nr:VanW family protein [Candidatus Caldatribacterium sp.]
MKKVFLLVLLLVPLGVYLTSSRGTIALRLGEEEFTVARRDLTAFLQTLEKRWKDNPLTIVVDGKAFEVPKESLGIRWNLKAMRRMALKGKPVTLLVEWDKRKIAAFLQDLESKTFLAPQDASWNGDRFIRAKEGRRLNHEKTLEALEKTLAAWKDTIALDTFDPIPPERDTKAVLEERGISVLLSSFETSLEGREEDVIFNIEKAASSISGFFLPKGTAFSFNAVVGRAEKEDGYRKTQVFSNGRLVPGYGGGVCQVSSTLYNALLATEAEILERHPHSGYSPTTSYVPPGLDAAVSYGSKDLRFRFPSQNVVILAYTKGNALVCEIWGEKENPVQRVVTQKLVRLSRSGESEGILTVETSIIRPGAQNLHFTDTYSIPWDFAQEIARLFPDS